MLPRLYLLPVLALIGLAFGACADDAPPPSRHLRDDQSAAPAARAQAIVDQAITTHGGAVLEHAVVEFDFRDKHFKITRDGGQYAYERTYTDSTGAVREIFNNDGIFREIDGVRVDLTDRDKARLSTPLNSVPYFALLPFNLNDPAVIKQYLGEVALEGEPYHKIEVTFRQEGGGRDYEDRFIYWFHRDAHTMDYLAYWFHDDEGGTRFRKAVNVRTVGGVRFADHLNYVSDVLPGPGSPIERYDELLESGGVELLSEINLENVTVRPLE